MLLRRTLPVVLAAFALAGCPEVDRDDGPASAAIATFDPNTGTIPLPNDLALQRAPALPEGVQRELLLSFVANGGWPSDQEVPVNIPVTVRSRQADGSYGSPTPPAGIDLATVSDDTVAFVQTNLAAPARILRCPTAGAPTATCWEPSYANGVLTLRRNGPDGHRRWDAGGRYVVGLRNTIRTTDGLAIEPDQAIALIAPNLSLTAPENQPPGAPAAALAQAEQLRGLYATGRFWTTVTDPATCASAGVPVAPCWLPLPAGASGVPAQPAAFESVSSVFPNAQLASIQTFTVSGATAVRPLTDSGSGQLPLPSDFLLNPATGLVRNVPAFGPAAAGLATLDGFSTTAPLLMPLSGAVKAETVTPASARIFEVTGTGLVPVVGLSLLPGAPPPSGPPQILVQPPTAIAGGLSTAVVLAPAVPIEAGATNLYLPPLKEKTQYLVVVTSAVRDAQDRPMRRSTLMDLVFTFNGDLCTPATDLANCTSRVPGVSNADAAGLQRLRASVKPALQGLGLADCSGGATCAVLAYTVKTQTVKDTSILLSAAPYGVEAGSGQAIFTPSAVEDFDTNARLGIPLSSFPNVTRFVRAVFPTIYGIEGSTGAFNPELAAILADPTRLPSVLKPIPALVAVPNPAAVPACPAGFPAGLRCAPLVVFQHGDAGSSWQMLPVADSLAARGFVVAAIDLPYHGERSFCTSNDECAQADGSAGVCTADASLQTPVDPVAPGTCTTGTLRIVRENLAPAASGNFFVSANFFRTRDAFRQVVLDQSALTLALARAPVGMPQPAANPFAAALGSQGIAIDPTKLYFLGYSIGGNAGSAVVATNPRFTRTVLSSSGGTVTDVFINSPSRAEAVAELFGGLGIDMTKVSATLPDGSPNPNFDPAVAADFAQIVSIVKWILDPAEALNYATAVETKTFHPDLTPLVTNGLGAATTQAHGQIATGDQTLPNPYSRLLFSLGGISSTTYTSAGGVTGNPHDLLLTNFLAPPSAEQQGGDIVRADVATFLENLTAPPPTRSIP